MESGSNINKPLCVESEFMENIEKCLDAITPKKYIISNLNETRETEDRDTETKP